MGSQEANLIDNLGLIYKPEIKLEYYVEHLLKLENIDKSQTARAWGDGTGFKGAILIYYINLLSGWTAVARPAQPISCLRPGSDTYVSRLKTEILYLLISDAENANSLLWSAWDIPSVDPQIWPKRCYQLYRSTYGFVEISRKKPRDKRFS